MIFGFTYIEANANDKIPYSINMLISIIIFAHAGLINYFYGISSLLGSRIGTYFGVNLALKKGNKWVKSCFIIIILLFSLKLIF
jgi:uncharacterized membrane protein YfcA